jgi:branched-chain amino acid transport system ATP-binding protein
MGNILEVCGATKWFSGLIANEDITFDVEEGEIVGIVGPNGAGKTTLFNSLSGVHRLTRGSIRFYGADITKKSANQICRLGIGRTFQIPQSVNELSVEENVLIGTLCRHPMQEAKEAVQEVLRECKLEAFAEQPAGKLNVAQKKRLEIARALATEPKLLLLDETMAGLTATERAESLLLIRHLNSRGISIITIEHNMDVVMNVSRRVIVLVSGRILTIGTPDEVTSNPDVISAYLGG